MIFFFPIIFAVTYYRVWGIIVKLHYLDLCIISRMHRMHRCLTLAYLVYLNFLKTCHLVSQHVVIEAYLDGLGV